MLVNWLHMEVVRLLVRVPLAVWLLTCTCGGAPPAGETPADLFRRLPANRTYSPADRALEDRIVALGDQALPVIGQELRLGIQFKELNTLLQTNGSRRAAAIAVLVRIPAEKATDLLVRSLADPPDSYGMRFATLQSLTNRVLNTQQIVALLRNPEPDVALAGIAQAGRSPASPEISAAMETLFDAQQTGAQFKNEYGAATANAEKLWDVRLAAGKALHRDLLPEIRAKAREILDDLEKQVTNPNRPEEPVRMGMLAEAESNIAHDLNRLSAFGEPIRDLVEAAAASAQGDHAKVLDMALVRLGDRQRVGRVTSHLTESPSPMIRVCAAITLRLSRDRSAIPALKQALRDPYQRKDGSDVGPRDRMVYPIRILAADALVELGEDPKETRKQLP
jgi:HEAT repeat protein